MHINPQRVATVSAIFLITSLPAASQSPPPDAQTCLTVTIGNTQDYSCLNQAFAALVPNQRLSSLNAPYNATSPAPKLGIFNQSATHEQLGSNFGKSAFPQRPAQPVFSIPSLNPR
jgi:hypothetical protein